MEFLLLVKYSDVGQDQVVDDVDELQARRPQVDIHGQGFLEKLIDNEMPLGFLLISVDFPFSDILFNFSWVTPIERILFRREIVKAAAKRPNVDL